MPGVCKVEVINTHFFEIVNFDLPHHVTEICRSEIGLWLDLLSFFRHLKLNMMPPHYPPQLHYDLKDVVL